MQRSLLELTLSGIALTRNKTRYHPNGLASIRMITDDDTQVPDIEMYEVYDAYGNEGYSNTLHDQPFKFTGEPKDEDETNLIYLRARYYDPVIDHTFTHTLICAILIFVRS